jgi:oligo-1,6-glucosidase
MLYNNTILQDIRLFSPYNSSIIHFLLCLNVILAKQHTEDYNNRKGFTKLISYIKGKIMIKKWWHDKVAYQIYPKSFLDTNGDGIGDLRGIISKLDYLKKLGIDIIWLSPIYKSPFVDQGYDISDYYAIAEEFGTMEEFDELLSEAKKRDMYIIMDLVINHCSDQHEWFQKALADPDGEYADYFYFRKGRNGNPPSNLRSYFGGSCWEPVPGTDKYYLHMFAKEQPDLNWENPLLREKLYEMINWWLEKGLAGFRIDAIINIKKDLDFPDFKPDGPDGLAGCWKMVDEVDGVGELLEDLKKHTFQKYEAFTVGEVFNMKEGELDAFIGENGHFSTIFDFSAHILSDGEHGWYDAPPVDFKEWRKAITDSQLRVQNCGLEANIIENHDEPRGVSRFLPDYAQNPTGAKMLGTISVLLRGIPFIYQGQEIGMQNAVWNTVDEYNDINTIDQYHTARDAGLTDKEALEACSRLSRDNARTPMQWNAEKNAGFTTGTPWLKVNDNYTEINMETQDTDPDSVLNYYRKLIALRKSPAYKEVFAYGEFLPVYQNTNSVMAYYRKTENQRILITANFGKEAVSLTLEYPVKQILLSNMASAEHSLPANDIITLNSCEVLVFELETL